MHKTAHLVFEHPGVILMIKEINAKCYVAVACFDRPPSRHKRRVYVADFSTLAAANDWIHRWGFVQGRWMRAAG